MTKPHSHITSIVVVQYKKRMSIVKFPAGITRFEIQKQNFAIFITDKNLMVTEAALIFQ